MKEESQSAPTTFLYTDLVNSTELLSRLGDERAQRVFQAHHKVLREATEANGGREVKWQGDGVMVAFASIAAAVRCAISMQQGASRPIDGERLEVRVGLNVGEALGWEDEDYFGTPVVVAARLCNQAAGGQILCSSVVAALLSGRKAFQFRAAGELELKGIAEPVTTSEVLYEREQPEPDAELIIYAPSGAVFTRWALFDQEVTIGRDSASDIQLEGRHISRSHAKVIRTPSGHRIVDLDSTNGVRKGGVRGASWDLSFGDEFELGNFRIAYVVSGDDPNRTIPDAPPTTESRLRVDDQRREVWLGEHRPERSLSRLEFKLLSFLYARAGRVCSRDELGAAIWGEGKFEDAMVHQLVHRLREKLGDDPGHPRYLINLPGQGYRLDP